MLNSVAVNCVFGPKELLETFACHIIILCTDFRRVETSLASLRGDGKVGFKGLSPGGWLSEAADK